MKKTNICRISSLCLLLCGAPTLLANQEKEEVFYVVAVYYNAKQGADSENDSPQRAVVAISSKATWQEVKKRLKKKGIDVIDKISLLCKGKKFYNIPFFYHLDEMEDFQGSFGDILSEKVVDRRGSQAVVIPGSKLKKEAIKKIKNKLRYLAPKDRSFVAKLVNKAEANERVIMTMLKGKLDFLNLKEYEGYEAQEKYTPKDDAPKRQSP